MAEEKFMTNYVPEATKVLDDEGKEVPKGPEALEHQRAQMEEAEKAAKEGPSEDAELAHTASQKAQKDGTTRKEALDKLKENKKEDDELTKEIGKTPAVTAQPAKAKDVKEEKGTQAAATPDAGEKKK